MLTLALFSLSVRHNRLTELPAGLAQLPKLEKYGVVCGVAHITRTDWWCVKTGRGRKPTCEAAKRATLMRNNQRVSLCREA